MISIPPKIIQKKKNLRTAQCYQNAFHHSLCDESDINNVFSGMLQNKQRHKLLSLYVNDEKRDDIKYNFTASLASMNKHNIYASISKLHRQRTGIFLRHAEQFDDQLTQKLACYLQPFLQKHGVPNGGLEMSLHIGNYGFTPSGINHNQNQGVSFQFHLGKHKKQMLLWQATQLVENSVNNSPTLAIQRLRDSAATYDIQPYELFIMPAQHYHIDHNELFSSTLVITTKFYPTKVLFQKFMSLMKQQFLLEDDVCFPDYLQHEELPELYKEQQNKCVRRSLYSCLQQAYYDYYFKLQSNCGFNHVAPSRNMDNISITSSTKLFLHRPYQLKLLTPTTKQCVVYARNHKLTLPKNSALIEMIDGFNAGYCQSFHAWLQALRYEWDEDLCRQFVYKLYQIRAIDIYAE